MSNPIFTGIDVSKARLDIAVLPIGKRLLAKHRVERAVVNVEQPIGSAPNSASLRAPPQTRRSSPVTRMALSSFGQNAGLLNAMLTVQTQLTCGRQCGE